MSPRHGKLTWGINGRELRVAGSDARVGPPVCLELLDASSSCFCALVLLGSSLYFALPGPCESPRVRASASAASVVVSTRSPYSRLSFLISPLPCEIRQIGRIFAPTGVRSRIACIYPLLFDGQYPRSSRPQRVPAALVARRPRPRRRRVSSHGSFGGVILILSPEKAFFCKSVSAMQPKPYVCRRRA